MTTLETIPTPSPGPVQSEGLLNAKGLLAAVWPDKESRPCERKLRQMAQEQRLIPFIKIGRNVWYDPIEVREAIKTKLTIGVKRK